MAALERVGSSNQWVRLKEQIRWEVFGRVLAETDETGEQGGRPPYDPVSMFRVVLLGQWHDLSDEELEHALRVRLDFLMFCGFTLSMSVPDRATINVFRNKLVAKGLLPKCLKLLNAELERVGIKVKSGRLVVDATIIESAARPRNIEILSSLVMAMSLRPRTALLIRMQPHTLFRIRACVRTSNL